MRIPAVLVVVAALFAGCAAARAGDGRDTLRIAWRDRVADVTPYYNQLRTGLILANEVWDGLVYRDPETFQIKPALALGWKQVDGTTIDFELRRGVTFQNGDPFTAEDVEYTIESVLTDPSVAVPSNYVYLAGAEKLDDYHVRVKLQRPFPAALEYLAMTLPILPKAYRARVGTAAFAQAPIGTGPYRITRIDQSGEIDLQRNDQYYAGSPKGVPAIARLMVLQVGDADAELALLMEGQVDWIWQFAPEQLEAIRRQPGLQTVTAETMRVLYLSLDAAGRSGAGNPLTDMRVRQAIMRAIDVPTLAAQVIQGGARPLRAPCYPTQFGCDERAAVRPGYDPAAARQLLADAGYPHGFQTELVSYVLPPWTRAVQDDLKAVGIDARIVQLDTGTAMQRSGRGDAPLFLGTWGSYSINDVSAFLPHFFTGGPEDYAHDPEVERLVREAGALAGADDRRADYAAAIRLITERALWLPLCTYVTTYAFTRSLDFRPFPDELPRFYLARWK